MLRRPLEPGDAREVEVEADVTPDVGCVATPIIPAQRCTVACFRRGTQTLREISRLVGIHTPLLGSSDPKKCGARSIRCLGPRPLQSDSAHRAGIVRHQTGMLSGIAWNGVRDGLEYAHSGAVGLSAHARLPSLGRLDSPVDRQLVWCRWREDVAGSQQFGERIIESVFGRAARGVARLRSL